MNFKEKLIALLESDLTSYAIVKDLKGQGYKTSTQFLDDYRNGKKEVDSMTLGKAEMLVKYYESNKERLNNENQL